MSLFMKTQYVCDRTNSIHVQIYAILLTQDVVYNINLEALLSFFSIIPAAKDLTRKNR